MAPNLTINSSARVWPKSLVLFLIFRDFVRAEAAPGKYS